MEIFKKQFKIDNINPIVVVLFLAFIIPFLINLGLFFTDIIAGKDIKFLEILYSNVGNEGWVSFWGNVMAGILPLGIIFYNEKEAKRQQKQFEEERQHQQEQFDKQLEIQERQFNEQLEIQKKHKKQEFYMVKFDKEKEIAQKVLLEWNKSIFNDLEEKIIKLFIDLLNSEERIKNLKLDEVDKIFEEVLSIRSKIVDKCNTNMTLLSLMEWRVSLDKETEKEIPLDTENTFLASKKRCYDDFMELYADLNTILEFLTEKTKFCESVYKIPQERNYNDIDSEHKDFIKYYSILINEYNDKINLVSNTLATYFFNVNTCLINYDFSHFELR